MMISKLFILFNYYYFLLQYSVCIPAWLWLTVLLMASWACFFQSALPSLQLSDYPGAGLPLFFPKPVPNPSVAIPVP